MADEKTSESVTERRPARALRVLVLTPEYVPHAWGGLATYLHEVVARLVARGAHVDVLLAPTYAPRSDSVDQDGLPKALIVDAAAAPEVHAAAIQQEWDGCYDVAFVQDPQAAPLAALLLSRSVCQRVVATAHLPTYSGFSYFDKPEDDARHQALEALLFRLSHRVVAPSRFAADVLLRVHRLDHEDIAVLTYGSPTLAPAARSRLDDGPLDVVSVGRVAKQKGLDDLCDISTAIPEHVASFTHIGSARKDGVDDALRQTRISRLGYRPYPEVLSRLLTADIVLSTSMYETFGLALLEGMAAGAVPVAFECGAYDEFIEPDISGVLIAPGDVTGAAEAIEFLHRDPARLKCLAEGAVEAAERFSWEEHVAGVEAVLGDA
jgi:1,2-diacylglycerol 3-alpha-glucosyltransferase